MCNFDFASGIFIRERNYMNPFILAAHDRPPVTRYTGYTPIGRDPLLVKNVKLVQLLMIHSTLRRTRCLD